MQETEKIAKILNLINENASWDYKIISYNIDNLIMWGSRDFCYYYDIEIIFL